MFMLQRNIFLYNYTQTNKNLSRHKFYQNVKHVVTTVSLYVFKNLFLEHRVKKVWFLL